MAAVVDVLALSAGAAAAFNPCGVGLLPTYLAFLLDRPAPAAWSEAVFEGLAAGTAMTVGLLVPFSALALSFGALAGWLGPHLTAIGAILGGAMALWGLLLLARPGGHGLQVRLPVPQSRARGTLGILVYGFVFALVSLGCTFPIFLSLLLQATTAGGPTGGVALVLIYALGMGLSVTVLAVAARAAARTARTLTARAAAVSARVTGVIVLASGLFVVAYFTSGLALP